MSAITTIQSPTSNFPLPSELLSVVIESLDPGEQRNMALVARVIRDHVLDIIYKQLSYTSYSISQKIRGIHQAREDVKGAIRKLHLHSANFKIRQDDNSSVIFQFLRTLPNLQTLEYTQHGHLIRPSEISQLFDSIRHAPLSELVLDTGFHSIVEGPLVEGIASLKKLSIGWCMGDRPDKPGSSIDHLYHIIRPSLHTLVELKIGISLGKAGAGLELGLLRDAGETLRVFDYEMRNHDEDILDMIPEIFSHLTKLALTWTRTFGYSLPWKDSHIISLSKNANLLDLQLSSDFEKELRDSVRADSDYAWYIRCYKRRLEATEKLAEAMPQLRNCSWLQLGASSPSKNKTLNHRFVVEERPPRHEGEQLVRVVRGVKQSWMGADRKDTWKNIVKCRLEDLPGDIIGENDPEEEDDSEEEEDPED